MALPAATGGICPNCGGPELPGAETVAYVVVRRFSPGAFKEPSEFKKVADTVSSRIKKECKGTVWKYSFATLGRFDVVDVVEAEDPEEVQRSAMIIRSYGHSTTETLLATPWKDFLSNL